MSSLPAAPHQSSELAVMHPHRRRSLWLAVRGSRCCLDVALVQGPWRIGHRLCFGVGAMYVLVWDRVLRSAPPSRASLPACSVVSPALRCVVARPAIRVNPTDVKSTCECLWWETGTAHPCSHYLISRSHISPSPDHGSVVTACIAFRTSIIHPFDPVKKSKA